MVRITLAETKVRKLLKESGGNQVVLRNLLRESMARKWLKSNGIPSWRNPVTPFKNADEYTSGNSRYSIMLADGSRFLVCSYPSPILSLDMLAGAKCFAALAVKLDSNYKSGSIMGCMFLRDISQSSEESRDFNQGGLESNSMFLHYLGVSGRYTTRLISFSIRLLLFGEPDAPKRGTAGIAGFCPTSRG
ncbi:MAG: hypothetical protein K8S62_05380 [Candidatus Sabulitectum sp.]|nr:hypothetical protein [Candidatus Sabulitectum sp.]